MRETDRSIFKPRNPSRNDILDTVGDQGMKKFRNPVHLFAVKDGWPAVGTTYNERADKKIMGMEMHPSHRNGPLGK